MVLQEIYRPIAAELRAVEQVIEKTLAHYEYKPIAHITDYFKHIKGKRLRPALLLLSAKAVSFPPRGKNKDISFDKKKLSKIAAAFELVHNASLIHDDVMDHAEFRHHRPTVNHRWGNDVAIALGDYLYSAAYDLISSCGHIDILQCISSATKTMCEGELTQVCARDDMDLLKQQYIVVVKKKTASLFAASCKAGTMAVQEREEVQEAFKKFGLHFGIGFQMADDCLDLIGDEQSLGKSPGADFRVGEITLPMINLLLSAKNRSKVKALFSEQDKSKSFKELRELFLDSPAFLNTKKEVFDYMQKAKKSLSSCVESPFKTSLCDLADHVYNKVDSIRSCQVIQ